MWCFKALMTARTKGSHHISLVQLKKLVRSSLARGVSLGNPSASLLTEGVWEEPGYRGLLQCTASSDDLNQRGSAMLLILLKMTAINH